MRKQKAKAKGKGAKKVRRFRFSLLLRSLILLARPVNALMSFFGVLVGAIISCGLSCVSCGLLAGVSAALVSAGGQVINDVFDVDVDKRSSRKKERPIPAGWIGKRAALAYAVALFALGTLLGFLVSPLHGAIALLASLALAAYSWKIQERKYVGNVLVSFFVGLLFVYGGLCGARWYATLIPAYLAFLANWAREIWKDVEDFEADEGRKRTLAHILTPRFASFFASYLALLAVMLSPLPGPGFFGFLGMDYLYVVALADVIFLLSAYLGVSGRASWAQRASKAGMLVAVAALLAGAV